ncbi:MAG: type II toxin-antitoxin system VapC family toxin [Spirochaetes bacterium]|nr:type II toxin-antitoxin system VapC family toxin [Spirochaetota bacterium]
MKLFFDTSALVKFFHEEKGTETITELIISPLNEIWILELAKLEFYGSLFRRYRNKELNEEKLEIAITGFEEELDKFNTESLTSIVLNEAEILIKNYGKKYGLRSLDSLHLGAYRLISDSDWYFVSADDNLCKVASIMDIKTINPLIKN